MKIYTIDKIDYIACKSLNELVSWYSENIYEIDQEEFKEVDIDKEGMWVPTKSKEDKRRLGKADELSSSPPEPGDLIKRNHLDIYKYITFREALEEYSDQEYIEPYVIASVDW